MNVWTKGAALLLLAFGYSTAAEAAECPVIINKAGQGIPFYAPDTRAGYVTFSFETPSQPTRFEIKGSFFRARQSNVVVYDQDAVQTDWLLDSEIEPDAGSVNPFRDGVAVDAPNRSYTITLAPGVTSNGNTLALPNSPKVSVWLRYYDLRNDAEESPAAFLPRIFAYDAVTGAPAPCPQQYDAGSQANANGAYLANAKAISILRSLAFYRYGGASFFSNPHNAYAFALPLGPEAEPSAVRFKAPTFLKDRSPNAVFTSQSETRFWSYCVTDFDAFYACIPDRQMTKDKNGNVTVVVGTASALAPVANVPGLNRLVLPAPKAFLMHYVRQLNARDDFAGDLRIVEPGERVTTTEVGAYAPQGSRCIQSVFNVNLCGLGKPMMP